MTRDGIADLSYINPGQMPGRFPIIAAGELPFMIREAHGATRAIDQWYKKYAATEMKDVKYCFSFTYDPARIHFKSKKVVVPADLKGAEGAPVARHLCQLGGHARRHQRARPARRKRAICSRRASSTR